MINNQYKIGASILRFLIGFFILKDFFVFFVNRNFLFDKNGIVSYETYLDIINYYNFNLLNIDFTNKNKVIIFLSIGILFSVFFMIGILQRISVIILYLLLFIFKIRNIYLLDGADNVISVILPFFLFINTYSLISKYEIIKNKILCKFRLYKINNLLSYYFSLAIMVQICIIYFFAGLHKLQGDVWRNGTALYYVLNSNDFSPTIFNQYITKSLFIVKLLTWFTIFFQLTFPFFVWFKKSQKLYILLGVILHIGIFFMMKIDNFSFILISCYSIFLSNSIYNKYIDTKTINRI